MLLFTSVRNEISPRVATRSIPKDPAALITAKGFSDIFEYVFCSQYPY